MIDIANIKSVWPGNYDEVWAVVRSMKSNPKHLRQVQDLSPSTALFHDYLNWKKAGKFDGAMFDKNYVPRFISELKMNPDARALLNKLYKMDKAGKRIALVCYCDNEWLCHRSILAGLLRGAGCKVNTNVSFIWYWDQWRAQ